MHRATLIILRAGPALAPRRDCRKRQPFKYSKAPWVGRVGRMGRMGRMCAVLRLPQAAARQLRQSL
mgnify:CR=1 FL=1